MSGVVFKSSKRLTQQFSKEYVMIALTVRGTRLFLNDLRAK